MKLRFGRQPPTTAVRSWGARAILDSKEFEKPTDIWNYKKDIKHNPHAFTFDLLYDRQDAYPPSTEDNVSAKKVFHDWVDNVGLPWLRTEVKRLRLAGSSTDVVAFSEGNYHIEASPQGSYGYLYIGAWEK